MEPITKEEFEAYVSVQESGVTNMFDVPAVIVLSGGMLDKPKCFAIMKQYGALKQKYGGVE